jgi:succinate dehydrogenase flavin-adding protein (antitoxin of CptAB toxin-antitoxin module)
MDFLLGRFTEQIIDSMNGDEITLLERLIEIPDPKIEMCLFEGYSLGVQDLDGLIERLRRFHGLPH